MRTLMVVAIGCLFVIGCDSENELTPETTNCQFINFKYYQGTKDTLGELSNSYILIGIDSSRDNNQIRKIISEIDLIDQTYDFTIHTNSQYKFKEIPLRLTSEKTCDQITKIISDLELIQPIEYVHYTMQTDNCSNSIWESIGESCVNSYGSNFYVKVFDENDLFHLNQMMSETNTELVNQNKFMEKWFELRATKNSSGDALKMGNYFYESDLFEAVDYGISKYAVE